ncbi:MAG: periplasmic heavy metal sensor [Opitutae bacterium]|nr:periplasmic heavy metal sensor [Opitutae bacterium]
MKHIVGFFITVIAVAALSSFLTMRWMESRPAASIDPHEWLHSALRTSPEQHRALEPIETKFAQKNRRLREQIRAANHELALAIGKGQPGSPEIAAAIGKVRLHMGELQNASIDHIFEMRAKLTPEQSETLLRLAQRTLDGSP